VDSGHGLLPGRVEFGLDATQILSLSKLLGLPGGGLFLKGEQYMHAPQNGTSPITSALSHMPAEMRQTFEYKEAFKNYGETIHLDAASWLSSNDLLDAIECERRERSHDLHALLQSRLANQWPRWMADAVAEGCAPGIAPLFWGASIELMRQGQRLLESELSIGSTISHFNWSGDPLCTTYAPCLAIPVHGQIGFIDAVTKVLDALL
jgi:hypothetical protein